MLRWIEDSFNTSQNNNPRDAICNGQRPNGAKASTVSAPAVKARNGAKRVEREDKEGIFTQSAVVTEFASLVACDQAQKASSPSFSDNFSTSNTWT